MMKTTSFDVMNNSSTGEESSGDQELGLSSMPKSVDIYEKSNSSFFSREMYRNLARVVVAEMIGTFILIFSITGIVASTQMARSEVILLEYAITASSTIVVIIFSIGPISGAHVNPSITIAFAIITKFPWRAVPLYIFAQIVGSILATYAGMFVFDVKSDVMVTRPLQSCSSAFLVELIVTFILMFLVASLIHQAESVGNLTGFVVGAAIGVAVIISGPVSGGSLNPARSLGAAIVSWKFKYIWIYITAPTIGAIGGSLFFQILRPKNITCKSTTSTNTCVLN